MCVCVDGIFCFACSCSCISASEAIILGFSVLQGIPHPVYTRPQGDCNTKSIFRPKLYPYRGFFCVCARVFVVFFRLTQSLLCSVAAGQWPESSPPLFHPRLFCSPPRGFRSQSGLHIIHVGHLSKECAFTFCSASMMQMQRGA